ncbi:MAG: hypothetical protein GX345_07145 [Clostridiales bacterium]|nr:hypothetical protein [Clostridiales bacterium]
MSISFKGFAQSAATFRADSSLKTIGGPVKPAALASVKPAAAGDDFCGITLGLKPPYATVLLGGYTRLPYTGTAPTLGYTALAADGSGGVKVSEGARKILVLEVDTSTKTVGFIL